MTTYLWRGAFTNDEINALHAQAFKTRIFTDDEWDWNALVGSHSLGWVVARVGDALVGFVNVVWDGLVHVWLQDTMVSATAGRRGIGTRLVATARDAARGAGCEYLHVDFEPHLTSFYIDACGFTSAPAGVMQLSSPVRLSAGDQPPGRNRRSDGSPTSKTGCGCVGMSRPDFSLRDAVARDETFIELMVLAAANWLPGRQVSLGQMRREPDLLHYVAGWPRGSDMGVVAVNRSKLLVGAVWLRQFSPEDPGYGYVSADVPELSIGVLDGWRGRGVGRALMRAQARQARLRGLHTLSLSVERANPAAALYLSEGWQVVESGRDSDTMVLELASDHETGQPLRTTG